MKMPKDNVQWTHIHPDDKVEMCESNGPSGKPNRFYVVTDHKTGKKQLANWGSQDAKQAQQFLSSRAMKNMKFELHDKDANDVFGVVDGDNVYIRTYGTLLEGETHPSNLRVGELTKKKYSLSGQKPTVYTIVRVQ